MQLQNPNSEVQWNDVKNTTPTFNLTPIEKPDFSPFLIHMTGKNSLVSILRGKNRPKEIQDKEKHGYLKPAIPESNSSQYYDSKVVCFTESPIFALDFFRYRSYKRWESDQQFGIGFSKTDLITKYQVRPVIYLDTLINKELLKLANNLINDQYQVIDNNSVPIDCKNLFSKLKPLLFPLLVETPLQGFMWEREWRCPCLCPNTDNGIYFPHSSIKVICCPSNERQEIEDVLGDLATKIDIIESWREYDDITNFLKQREEDKKVRISRRTNISNLIKLKNKYEQILNALFAYQEIFKEKANKMEAKEIQETISKIIDKKTEIDKRINEIEEQNKHKK
ncbi:MAG TPA: hypothetical protein PK230_02285 [Chitinophagales bacterium]|nr:hypothetical protein [Chitinophagales bacterium]